MKRLIAVMIVISSLLGVTKTSNAQVAVGISVDVAPPAIPVYAQPPCPVEGYLWTPGYWYWGTAGYYWVPGVWCRPARVGFLWTPGYWGWEGGHYWWHGGYWGEHVGFYGGVNYGFGYGGNGFYGGRWEGGAFRYNTAVWRTGAGFHNTYVDRSAIVNNNVRTSYNGGNGGLNARPSAEEQSYSRESHTPGSSEQQTHERNAGMNTHQFANNNGGHPTTTARSSVGGQRYNSAGNAMHSAARPNAGAQNRGGMQGQHGGAMQNRGGGGRQSGGGGRSLGGGRGKR